MPFWYKQYKLKQDKGAFSAGGLRSFLLHVVKVSYTGGGKEKAKLEKDNCSLVCVAEHVFLHA